MSKTDFGIFNNFWNNGQPNHLPFLGMAQTDSDSPDFNLNLSLELLDQICGNATEADIIIGIHKLLESNNWRPHLIGILSSFKISKHKQQELIPFFWDRLSQGSWISRQIVCVLSIIDSDFTNKTNEILAKGFDLTHSQIFTDEGQKAKSSSEKVITSIKQFFEVPKMENSWKNNLVKLIEDKTF